MEALVSDAGPVHSPAGEPLESIDADQTRPSAPEEPAMAIDANEMHSDPGVPLPSFNADQAHSATVMPAVATVGPIAKLHLAAQAATDKPYREMMPAKSEEMVCIPVDGMMQKTRQTGGNMSIDADQTRPSASEGPAMAIDANEMHSDPGVPVPSVNADQTQSASVMPAVATVAPIANLHMAAQATTDNPYRDMMPAKNEEMVCNYVDGMLQKTRQTRGNMFLAISAAQRSNEVSGNFEKKKAGRSYFGPNTRWTTEETEALLIAIESCQRSDPFSPLRAYTWDRVLQHMQEHGFSQKTARHAEKKFGNMRWAFRKVKAWRIRRKLPLFEDLSPWERRARHLPCSHCPKEYARMEAFFASTGLDDGVSKVRDEDHVTMRKKSACAVRCRIDDHENDIDNRDVEYHVGYQSTNEPSQPIRSNSRSQVSTKWCNRLLGNKSQGKPVWLQPRKQPFRHCFMRGLLLNEKMDLENYMNERRLYIPDVYNDECHKLEEDDNSMHVGEAKKARLTGIDSDECTKSIDRALLDNDKGVDSSNESSDQELKIGKPCVENSAGKSAMLRDTKRQLRDNLQRIAALCDAGMDNERIGSPQNVEHAACEDLGRQHSMNDRKVDLQAILEQTAINNKQMSDCIRGVILSIQNVKLVLDAYQLE